MGFKRERIVSWLESNQENGAFEGFPEHDMDFRLLPDEDLKYYFYEWAYDDISTNE